MKSPSNNLCSAKKIIDRIRSAYKFPSDLKLADFLGVAPSTISTWKRRNSVDYDLIFIKCKDLCADYLLDGELPIYKNEKYNHVNEPVKDSHNDQILSEYEQKVAQIVTRIEHGPYSAGLKIQIIDSLLEVLDNQLVGHPVHSNPSREGKKSER